MYNFKNDYSEGAHPRILEQLVATNFSQQLGYGDDDFSKEAKALLKGKLKNDQAEIYFVSGGTQANMIVMSALLRTHEAVISAKTGHISANETGAIEATGHKVITVESTDGKLYPHHVSKVLEDYALFPHVVKPRMVYISNSTEIGTIYTKKDLTALAKICKESQLLLYMDGARMGHALTATNNDLTLQDISRLTDLFYLGATKNGGLLGEAIIFNSKHLDKDFDFIIKQKGALLSKGRLLGIQFLELFRDELYFDLARHANQMAMKLSAAIKENGYSMLTESTTNQIFPILPKSLIEALSKHYHFYIWKKIDEQVSAIRLTTSWATDESEIDAFISKLSR